jgi:predicted acetyltransferase
MEKRQLLKCLPGELTETQRFQVCELMRKVWPTADEKIEHTVERHLGRDISRPKRETVLLYHEKKLVAHAESFEREIITVMGERIPVMALASVCVDPEWRGYGFGAEVVKTAFQRVDSGEFPLALYMTDLPDFYRPFGAEAVANRFVNRQNAEDPEASPWSAEFVMIYPASVEWPHGVIDLNGPEY